MYRDDGNLSIDDFITENDDDLRNTDDDGSDPYSEPYVGDDGSIYHFDSYINVFLRAGDYLLSVHACCIQVGDDFDGFMGYGATLSSNDPETYSDHGDYQITFTGDVTVPNAVVPVPEPTTIALFSIGLVGLIWLRRKRT